MSEVVELDSAQPCSLQRLPPPVADAVLVDWLAALSEQPLLVACCADLSDVRGDEIDDAVGEVDDSL